MLVLGMRGETWLTESRCDCPWLEPFDWGMSKDVVSKRKDEVWSSSIIRVILMNDHPNSFETFDLLEAFPSEGSTKGSKNIDNIIRNVLLFFDQSWCIHLWSHTITYNGNTVCVSYVQVHLGKVWHTTTSTDLTQLHLTCHCLILFDGDLPMVSLVVHDGGWSS